MRSMTTTGQASSAHGTASAVVVVIVIVVISSAVLLINVSHILLIVLIIAEDIAFAIGVFQGLVIDLIVQVGMPRVLRPSSLLRLPMLPIGIPRTGIQVVTLSWMRMITMVVLSIPAEHTWLYQIVIFPLLSVSSIEVSRPFVTMAAVFQVKGHPVSDRLAKQEVRSVAVVVIFEALPILENPHRVVSSVDLKCGRRESLASESEEDQCVLV